ncbi:uncharacterized protein EI90DRAFT_3144002 [Cantharellus anzutake]|uniref:uncharacterized protein n=1 Tax=Cantharellus anzutake TaxID=1750568 RepID=UPI00190557D5|nr:uncharacterized protein EI90DRAFT_3144002 [Cantharellus anzutake]KAF8339605.1 hypothetical protein EI90DRAFT_3144002 [Cantharellus anzutake]
MRSRDVKIRAESNSSAGQERQGMENFETQEVAITEDEAALYDRQIRLWGLDAQQRMRNATVVVVNLKGLGTEIIKNIVLAGIGKLIVVDENNVTEEDLGAGFFFTEEDVGKNRAESSRLRIQNLNPRVIVETVTNFETLHGTELEKLVESADLVCVTDRGTEWIIPLNEECARQKKKFYCGATYGLSGFIFCDLSVHQFLTKDKTRPGEEPKDIKATMTYPTFSHALQHSWENLSKRQTKELNPATVFTVMAILEWQTRHQGQLPDGLSTADELEVLANTLLKDRDVNSQIIQSIPRHQIESAAITAAHELSPVCAVVGGFLAQDILKALSAKDPPLANFFTFDGTTGGATVCRLGVPR